MPFSRKIKSCIAAVCLCLAMTGLAGASDAEAIYRNNVVVVLDASGSMDNNIRSQHVKKMDAAKTALLEVLKHVSPDTHVGLLVFSAKGITDPWLYPLGPVNANKLQAVIKLPQPGGATPLGEYIKRGADRLLLQRKSQHGYGTYRLLIVTDGEATDGALMEKYTPEVISRGITVDVIGVDMAAAHTLATRVHSYRNANDPASLKKAVADVFAEVGATQGGGSSGDAFMQIAPISGEMATAMLQALANSGNAPIGEKKKDTYAQRAAPPPASPPTSSPSSSTAPKKEGSWWPEFVLGLIILMAIFSGKKKR